MGVTTTKTNKPLNPRGNDQSPLAFNRAKLYSGKALDFDGVNDSIDISNFSLNGYTAFSICFYKTADFPQNRAIFSSADDINDGFNLYQVSPGYFRARLNGVNVDTDTLVSQQNGFFVFTYDGSDGVWYQDGQSIGTGTTSQTLAITNTTSTIARYSYSATSYLDGQIAGFKIFNTALTAAQVADLYNNPEKVVPTGVDNTALKLWLPMMEGAGTTAYDGSGNGNHGTISGATYVNGIGAPVAQSAVIDWNKGTNLVPYSEELDEWTASALSVVQSSATAPDGSTNAYTLTDNSFSSYGICFPSSTISMSGDYVASVFIKKTTGSITNYPGLDIAQRGTYLIIDTTNGTSVESGSGSNYTDVTITSYNDDWWRVSAKLNYSNTARPMRLWAAISSNGTSIASSATGSATFWGAQVEQADAIGPYVRTGATAQTSEVLLPQGLTTGRDITGVNLFENVRKQGALNLDGNSWAEVHDNASLDVSVGMTMECWVYINDITTGGRLISKWGAAQPNRSYQMFMNNALVRSLIGDGTTQAATQTTTSLSVGNWYHIAVTYNQTNLKTYLNGVEDDSQNVTFTIYDSDEPVYLGRYVNSSFESVNPIAQPRIYNRALTAEEVQRNYNAGKNIYTNS
jgi:hypothetical protein